MYFFCMITYFFSQKRLNLEEANQLPSKDNYLEDDMEDVESSEEEEEMGEFKVSSVSDHSLFKVSSLQSLLTLL